MAKSNVEKIISRVKKAEHTLESVPDLVRAENWNEVGVYLDEAMSQLYAAGSIADEAYFTEEVKDGES